MTSIRNLFLLLAVIGPLHMAEQFFTSIEEFYKLRGYLDRYYAWATWTDPDRATVVLITVVFTAITLFCHALLVGGVPRLAAVGVFGLLAIQEIHHVFEAFAAGGYDPGVITCVPYFVAGSLLIASVVREFTRTRRLDTAPIPDNYEHARRLV